MTKKISIAELRTKLLNSSVDRSELEKYFIQDVGRTRPFGPAFTLDPQTVDLEVLNADEEAQGELAFDIANRIARAARKNKFETLIEENPERPILYAEGDSWFQFPFFLSEIIDYLEDDMLICDTSKAGDTLKNMICTANPEYLNKLTELIVERALMSKAFCFRVQEMM